MILVTGWTGNTGSLVLKEIMTKFPTKKIVGVSRSRAKEASQDIISEQCDLSNEHEVTRLFETYKFELIIHIANIRYSPIILKLANDHKVKHVILIHTTGIYSKYRAYSSLYKDIEGRILNGSYSNTKYTILRPTMIYGNLRDHNLHKLIRFLNKYPVFPVFGDGSALMQPVHVEDLAQAIINCIDNEKVKNGAYDLSGGSVHSYQEILNIIVKLLDKKVMFIHIPIKLALSVIGLYNRMFKSAAISVEQVERLQEDKAYSHAKAKLDLSYSPRPFFEGIAQEIEQLKREEVIR